MDKEVDKEATSQERRLKWAIFLSVILHILLIFLLSNLRKDVPNEQSKVITVRLVQDNLSVAQEKPGNNKNTSVKKESAPPRKEVVRKNADKKRTEQKPAENKSVAKKDTKTIEKKETTKEPDKVIEKQNNPQVSEEAKPVENTTAVTEEDIFDKIETSQKEAAQQLEKDFFEETNVAADVLPDFDFSDILLADNSAAEKNSRLDGSGENKDKNKSDNTSSKGEGIEWSSGGSRGLLYSTAIEVPEEVRKAGLKFKIEIDFDVDPNGYIRNANILKSSGNSLWDEEIRKQFCEWQFEKSSKQENSSGKIIISIDY